MTFITTNELLMTFSDFYDHPKFCNGIEDGHLGPSNDLDDLLRTPNNFDGCLRESVCAFIKYLNKHLRYSNNVDDCLGDTSHLVIMDDPRYVKF